MSNALANGGAARVLTLIAEQFAANGRDVGIFVFRRYPKEYQVGPAIHKEYSTGAASLLGRVRRLARLRAIAKSNPGATIVSFEHFVNAQTLLACIGLKNRVVVSERNDPSRVGNGFWSGRMRSALYRRADAVVCQTDEAANYFGRGINTVVILNPVKADLPRRDGGPRRRAIVNFGRLEPQKDLPALIEAFRQFRVFHPEYSLEIYGDGTERAALVKQIADLSLSSVARVLPARHDIHDLVKDSAMYVSSSLYEGLSNSMIESMAMGLPTICTDCPCGGARMVIDEGENGLIVPVADTAALVAAMRKVADDDVFADGLGVRAQSIRTRLAVEAIVEQWSATVFAL